MYFVETVGFVLPHWTAPVTDCAVH